ncbi:hypothetical protein PF005_g1548 [Phytophthora fragariae]|uniref:Myb-like domain-containing protein n=2 Tax=Phytophthora fragariae TaxID=53985 RepID=A0A6A3TD32_9STRA|nr:hypothetical protein PF003_g1900 [Phytophthora fragariae]KAE8945969.1 hypothetical protein PF009_g4383 [Phytophthora fragariae]KAE9011144.1 hypothetical protein PF011_g9502 [Phytophthora fragariae]KAE9131414.1 hypothetical protein PF010_g3498 [Phytophthora fragariae]KAE9131503.1 hypothetical protein PF007_g4112 [Phytophthora fragariae]
MSVGKRRNYSEEEDVMLLRQVLGDRRFEARRGKITGAWDALAAKLVAEDSFPRLKLSGKNAQSRFDKLVKTRRQENEESMAPSGVSEEESEKALLLDELIELVDDHNESVCAAKVAVTLKRQRDEEASATARRLAMETLGEDLERSPQGKRLNREELLKDMLLELKEKELQDKREARELMAAQREADREHMLALVQSVLKNIVDLISLSKKN